MSVKKVLIKIFLVALIITPVASFFYPYMSSNLNTPIPDIAWVSWYDNPQERVYIGWETGENVSGTINFGKSPDSLLNEVNEAIACKYHIVNLTGLDSDTKYYYKITIGGSEYTTGQFKTAPSTNDNFNFLLTSDTQPKFGPGWQSHIADIFKERYEEKDYAFVSLIGDFIEDGTPSEWNDFFARAGTYLDRIPLIPVQGNHDRPRDFEGDGVEEMIFQKYFPNSADLLIDKNNNNSYDIHKQFYYSFNWSNVHFQILHFPEIDIDDAGEDDYINPTDYNRAFTDDHIEWLKNDLKNSQDKAFRITMFHCPITSSGFYGPNHVLQDELLPILLEHNVTATIHGHAHHFEHGIFENKTSANKDMHYYVVGTGGGLADVALRPVSETVITTGSPSYTEVHYASGTAGAEDTLTFSTYTFEHKIVENYTMLA